MTRNIALAGLMGSGKTRVGRLVAERLGRGFVDTDSTVEQSAGRSIDEIFASDGEKAFRALERRAVSDAASGEGEVIALGGGAVCDPANVAALRSSSVIVLLDAPTRVLAERVHSGAGRPLLGTGDTQERLDGLRAARDDAYRAAADWTIDTAERSADEIADALLLWARGQPNLLSAAETEALGATQRP